MSRQLSQSLLALLTVVSLAAAAVQSPRAAAETTMSSIFGDSMVLQRDQPIRVWGWTVPNQQVEITLGETSQQAVADSEGRFDLKLDAMPAGGPHQMVVQADEKIVFEDVLIGEVWLCSGQSNMAWPVSNSNDADLEALAAKFPNIRLISVPQVGTQEPQNDFDGQWQSCSPETVKDFSAVGYFFGRQLHQTLDVPIGLIDNAWGGSAAEAWVRRDRLEADKTYEDLLEKWEQIESNYDHEQAMAQWRERVRAWAENRRGSRPRPPRNQLAGQHRPANLYNGVLRPILGYTIAGVIWYQGESNSGRAYQYRELFPLMIQNWRDEWAQGNFPFYWVQLADYQRETDQPAESAWAELREAQTMTAKRLPHTGQAVITDLGEAEDIHPRNKQDVAKRLARLALKNEYGYDIVAHSPTYESMEVREDRVLLSFDHIGGGLDTFDVRQPLGFTIAGEDKKFVPADAKLVDTDDDRKFDSVEVWSDSVDEPVAVRYAWADNPVCNVQNVEGLPLTPFRTDDWRGVTADVTR